LEEEDEKESGTEPVEGTERIHCLGREEVLMRLRIHCLWNVEGLKGVLGGKEGWGEGELFGVVRHELVRIEASEGIGQVEVADFVAKIFQKLLLFTRSNDLPTVFRVRLLLVEETAVEVFYGAVIVRETKSLPESEGGIGDGIGDLVVHRIVVIGALAVARGTGIFWIAALGRSRISTLFPGVCSAISTRTLTPDTWRSC